MNIESKQFWEQVKKEYNPNIIDYFICDSSVTFSRNYVLDLNYKINLLAHDFIKCINKNKFYIGVGILFLADVNEADVNERIKIRIDFIDWCIKKYS